MRRFEYIGGGSEKFWEIDRAGGSVTVRFGRIGTAGQTQVKDLGSDQAAGAHVAKLIAEKVKKGYLENGSVSAPAPSPKPAPAPAPPPPQVPAGPDGDEDTWTVPPAWWRAAQPFRGRSPARPAALDPASARIVADLRARATRFEQVLDHPSSDVELVDLARLHLTAAGDSPPLGAAVAGAVLASTTEWGLIEGLPAVVDEWVNSRGPVFAA
ncbi:MAG TPA: WGR domain-containing protein, partial [Acidimicrobiales bacterium]|nr:WGR domain-containing protein [Acidimicrobiales bacterium]